MMKTINILSDPTNNEIRRFFLTNFTIIQLFNSIGIPGKIFLLMLIRDLDKNTT